MGDIDLEKLAEKVKDYISSLSNPLHFSASPENVEFFEETLGLQVSVKEDGVGTISGPEAKKSSVLCCRPLPKTCPGAKAFISRMKKSAT